MLDHVMQESNMVTKIQIAEGRRAPLKYHDTERRVLLQTQMVRALDFREE